MLAQLEAPTYFWESHPSDPGGPNRTTGVLEWLDLTPSSLEIQ
jgi:hypothetical protein